MLHSIKDIPQPHTRDDWRKFAGWLNQCKKYLPQGHLLEGLVDKVKATGRGWVKVNQFLTAHMLQLCFAPADYHSFRLFWMLVSLVGVGFLWQLVATLWLVPVASGELENSIGNQTTSRPRGWSSVCMLFKGGFLDSQLRFSPITSVLLVFLLPPITPSLFEGGWIGCSSFACSFGLFLVN